MKAIAPVLIVVGLILLGGSMFMGGKSGVAPIPEEQVALVDQAAADLHGASLESMGSEKERAEAKLKAEKARAVIKETNEKAAAKAARSSKLASFLRIGGVLAAIAGAGMHFYVANTD